MFICSNYTFFVWGEGRVIRPYSNGGLTCDSVSSPGKPHKQVAYNFKLLRVPLVFESNVHNVIRYLLQLSVNDVT